MNLSVAQHNTSMEKITCPKDIVVQLTGTNGNVFCIIGTVSQALKTAGFTQEADAFTKQAMACGSYDDVLQLCMRTVNVS